MMTFLAFGALLRTIIVIGWAGVFVVISKCAVFFTKHTGPGCVFWAAVNSWFVA
jgi:hypothetical protein